MYACAGGHEAVVRLLLENGSHVEDHNENGHTPLMEAASAGHVGVAKILLQYGAGINTHSNEFKESALTLACYKGNVHFSPVNCKYPIVLLISSNFLPRFVRPNMLLKLVQVLCFIEYVVRIS